MTSRIRCSCGRVYDPQKHTHCPECGAESAVESVVVSEKVKPSAVPEGKLESKAEERNKTLQPSLPGFAQLVKAVPWPVFAGVALLFIIILAVSLRHRNPGPSQASSETGRESPPTENSTPTPPAQASPAESASGSPTAPVAMANLNDLIAGAGQSGTVKLRPGLYQGGVTINRPLHIVGDPQNSGQIFIQSDTKDVIAVRSKGVVIENVQVMFNGTGEAAAISIADNAELQLDGSKIASSSSYGVTATAGASVKATNSTFSASNGTAMQLDRQGRGNFTQCNFTDAQTGLRVSNGSNCELHGCAFERNGARSGRGAIIALTGDKTRIDADQCRFASNPAGIDTADAASLALTNSLFKDNGISSVQGNSAGGLLQVKGSAFAKLEGDTFESNGQGVVATNGGKIEIDKCRFSGNGLQTRGELILGCMTIAGNGQGSVVTVRNSSVNTSASYAVGVVWSARLDMEETEVSGARTVGLLVGDRKGLPATAEAKHCHFLRNTTGVGVCAGSSAIISDSECRENSEGAVALDRGTRLNLSRTAMIGNREHGLCVYGGAVASAVDSQIENNSRGAQSGMQKKSNMSGTLTLQNCRVAGNQVFGVGAYAKSQLTLTGVTFEANGKTNIYRESGAIVQSDGEAQASNEGSDQSGDQNQKRKKPRRQSDEDARQIIRRFFRP
jgi:hypothetical protein